MGHERRFRDLRDESGLPPTPERLQQGSASTLRANCSRLFFSPSEQCKPLKRLEWVDGGGISWLFARASYRAEGVDDQA